MRNLKIDIAEDTVSKIQRIHSETEARMLLLNRLMETHKDDASFIDSALFKKYHEEYVTMSTTFDEAKHVLEADYIPKYLQDHQLNWNLDYATCQLNVDILCDCDIPELN